MQESHQSSNSDMTCARVLLIYETTNSIIDNLLRPGHGVNPSCYGRFRFLWRSNQRARFHLLSGRCLEIRRILGWLRRLYTSRVSSRAQRGWNTKEEQSIGTYWGWAGLGRKNLRNERERLDFGLPMEVAHFTKKAFPWSEDRWWHSYYW